MQGSTTTSTTPPTRPVEDADVIDMLAQLRDKLRGEKVERPTLRVIDGGAA